MSEYEVGGDREAGDEPAPHVREGATGGGDRGEDGPSGECPAKLSMTHNLPDPRLAFQG